MQNITNVNMWEINFSLDSKIVKNTTKNLNHSQFEIIENQFLKIFPNLNEKMKSDLINIDNENKSISFNLNHLM